jgi:hypothetical protein
MGCVVNSGRAELPSGVGDRVRRQLWTCGVAERSGRQGIDTAEGDGRFAHLARQCQFFEAPLARQL